MMAPLLQKGELCRPSINGILLSAIVVCINNSMSSCIGDIVHHLLSSLCDQIDHTMLAWG